MIDAPVLSVILIDVYLAYDVKINDFNVDRKSRNWMYFMQVVVL